MLKNLIFFWKNYCQYPIDGVESIRRRDATWFTPTTGNKKATLLREHNPPASWPPYERSLRQIDQHSKIRLRRQGREPLQRTRIDLESPEKKTTLICLWPTRNTVRRLNYGNPAWGADCFSTVTVNRALYARSFASRHACVRSIFRHLGYTHASFINQPTLYEKHESYT